MCEWLSSSEWCDVKVACGGKTFNAHRAVLASASVFLRRVLLSCPDEDTPVLVLPDFDIEAMSSVLYYVYNGEVFIDNSKLAMFLDIIKTLEIFIDQRYLKKLDGYSDGKYSALIKYHKSQHWDNVIKMNSQNCNEPLNIGKGEKVQDKSFQYSFRNSDHSDKRDRCLNRSELHPSVLYLDRQRNSFLRDLYIETYPQNGNVNGMAGGVLAISNERYRAPTSFLLTNANGKLPIGADDRLSATRKLTESELLPNLSHKHKGCDQRYMDNYNKDLLDTTHQLSLNLSKSRSLRVDSHYDLCINYNKSFVSNKPTHPHTQSSNDEMQEKIPLATLDLSLTKSLVSTVLSHPYGNANKYVDAIRLMQSNINYISRKFPRDEKGSLSHLSKVPIFNQVIDSPWRPRLPNNYKPLKRKATHVSNTVPTKKEKNAVVNDSNNNVEPNIIITHNPCVEDNNSSSETQHKCSICSQVFTSEDYLAVHVKRHETNPRYSCNECGKTFSQLRNFKYHVSVHRGTKEFAATCTVCGKYFNDRGYLSSHMKIHRNRKEYKCSMCPKSFNQRVAYNMHLRIHTGVKPHVCEECGKAFSRKMLLKQHQRTHSGERPYACPHCEKRFADRSNMTLHLRLHTGVKPFSCSMCPKSFTKKHHLKSHLNFHTGAKPYSCPRCKLAFTQSSNMRTHLKKCTVAPGDNISAI